MTPTKIVSLINKKYPSLILAEGDNYYWSPTDKTVRYKKDDSTKEGAWALLHESGHALLEHRLYYTDIELVSMEVDAWEQAKEIAKSLRCTISEDHIQDCLDSYRDWLHKRSLCPDCNLSGIQVSTHMYLCIFCHKKWKVTTERFCRPYRASIS